MACTNLLADQTSPYLLQHAHNPVDWRPWGDDAFTAARELDRPVFLSVGYATCHWCHVMAHESFEDDQVAAALNEHFICIKVDREERPDIDAQYMLATQLMTQRGGWPNSVWLTPDGRPWFAGTYFPKDDHFGRPGFLTILNRLAAAWRDQRKEVEQQADQLTRAIAQAEAINRPDDPSLSMEDADRAVEQLRATYDSQHGGFGSAPKFPPHGALALLTSHYDRTRNIASLDTIAHTLGAMACGGIHDQVGGGFHRYSTDSRWLVPHFEKMLYDNAQLLRAYAESYRLTQHEGDRRIADRIVAWLEREMRDPGGGFYSAIDADSEGEEGRFYVWTTDEIRDVLGEGAEAFIGAFGAQPTGNWREEATGHATGTNILHLSERIEPHDGPLDAMLAKLLSARDRRARPQTDDKVLTCWNGLMIGALAYAGVALDRPHYVELAKAAASFVLSYMQRDGRLLRTWRDGAAHVPGYLDDYAMFIEGLLELHEASGKQRWLDEAQRLADIMMDAFADRDSGAFCFTSDDHEALLGRSTNPLAGGNTPNANAVACGVLPTLGARTGDARYAQAAARCLLAFAGPIGEGQYGQEAMLVSLAEHLRQRDVDVIAGAAPITMEAATAPRRLSPGEAAELTVRVHIDSPFHLYAADRQDEHLTPTALSITPHEHVTIGDVSYPDATDWRDPHSGRAIAVYTGDVVLSVPITLSADAPEGVKIDVQFTGQPCDDERCLAPVTYQFAVPLQGDRHAE